MKQPTVTVLGGAFEHDVALMFHRRGFKTTTNLGAANLICFTGGADISPSLYNEPQMSKTWPSPARDRVEVDLFKKYKGKPFVGICRGAQLLNVLSGGSMYQDVTGHGGAHPVRDLATKRIFLGTSIHHQMMRPSKDGVIVAVADRATELHTPTAVFRRELEPDVPEHWTDVEVVYYPETKALCYQGHPETAGSHERDYFFGLIERYLKLYGLPVHKSAAASAEVFNQDRSKMASMMASANENEGSD